MQRDRQDRRAGASGRLVATAAAVALSAGGLALAAEAALVLEPERYNRDYTGLAVETQPIVRGPLTVRLSSPRFDLTVLASRLELAAAGGCHHDTLVWGRFRGDGELEADVELGGFPGRFEDRVRIPEQERQVAAKVTIEGGGTGDYEVTLEELPATVVVRVESELAGSLVSFCRRLSLFVVGDAGCGALDHALSNPRLPLPEPGTRFVVRRDELTPEERARLARYRAGAGCS